jgi:transposase
MTVAEYLNRKYILLNTTRKLSRGKMVAIYKGETIPEKDFQRIFALPTKLNASTENPNKKASSLI